MCCPGCQAVARLIADSGLDGFYRLRTAPGPRPDEESAADEFSVYDSAESQRDFVEVVDASRRRARLLIGGIGCAACTWLIETALERLEGVSSADANLARRSLLVEWDSARLSLGEILRRLHALGYRPQPWQSGRVLEAMAAEQRAALGRLAVAGLAMMQVGMFGIALHAGDLQGMQAEYRSLLRWVSLIVATVVVLYSAGEFFRNAWTNLGQRRLVMDLPVALAIGLAYGASAYATATGRGEVYFDSVAMFTFFLLLGRFLERRARRRELLGQTDLQSLLPPSCRRQRGDGWETVSTRRVVPGDVLAVKSGALIPADGTVLQGSGSVDESAFSGEPLPRAVAAGDEVAAGALLARGDLRIRANTDLGNSRIAAMLGLAARAEHRKPRLAQIADRVAGRFVGAVLLVAGAVFLYWWNAAPDRALWICLSVLVVSCPCALALATPAALTSAAANLRGHGLLIAGENALENLARCTWILFDKTGTLTEGRPALRGVVLRDADDEDFCLRLAAAMEAFGNHPIAGAFAHIEPQLPLAEVENVPGQGVTAKFADVDYAMGHAAFAQGFCTDEVVPPARSGHWIALVSGTRCLAWFEVEDAPRPETPDVMRALGAAGLKLGILSGDRSGAAARLAAELGVDDCREACSPADKLEYIRRRQRAGERLAMVGDGLNDAPVLAAADCSFAVNGATDLAKSRADILMLKPDLRGLPRALSAAAATRRVIRQNVCWALGYNGLAVPLAAAGLVPPWAAAVGMSLSSLLVVGNSLRLSR